MIHYMHISSGTVLDRKKMVVIVVFKVCVCLTPKSGAGRKSGGVCVKCQDCQASISVVQHKTIAVVSLEGRTLFTSSHHLRWELW